jgi:hypothetical protein
MSIQLQHLVLHFVQIQLIQPGASEVHGYQDVYVSHLMHGLLQRIHVHYGVIVVVMEKITQNILYL